MRIRYKNKITGKKAWEQDDISVYQLTEGNWSCDCNRAKAFGQDTGKGCIGCIEYIVDHIESDEHSPEEIQKIIEDANLGYSVTKTKKYRLVVDFQVEYDDFPENELKNWVKDRILDMNQSGWDSSGIQDYWVVDENIEELK